MNEVEFLEYCQAQVSGSLSDEDIVTMLTAWGSIKYTQGYNKGLEDKVQETDENL